MFTSHCDILSTLYHIPSLFRHAISSRSDHATVFSRYSHVFEKNRKRSSCRFVPKRAMKRKQRNCFDKDWAYKHAASDKGSYYKQNEFGEGQDLEEAAISLCSWRYGYRHPKLTIQGVDQILTIYVRVSSET